jgi:hypothetical protein
MPLSLESKGKQSKKQAEMLGFLLIDCLAYSSILKREPVHSTEALVNVYQSTRRHILEDNNSLHSHSRKDLRSRT